jgi:hypothetical protein
MRLVIFSLKTGKISASNWDPTLLKRFVVIFVNVQLKVGSPRNGLI